MQQRNKTFAPVPFLLEMNLVPHISCAGQYQLLIHASSLEVQQDEASMYVTDLL